MIVIITDLSTNTTCVHLCSLKHAKYTSSSVAVDRTSKKNTDQKVISDEILCVQLDRNLRRVYLKNVESRINLLTRGIEINSVSFQFYGSNSYATGAKPTDKKNHLKYGFVASLCQ